jgi:CubicO group peptidase (beta-lactamase class C family)
MPTRVQRLITFGAVTSAVVTALAIGTATRPADAQAAAASAARAPALPLDSPAFAARLDGVFAPWTGTDRPGCAVGVSRRGRTVLERAYGMADLASGAPMTPTTVVHSASLAKQVTALAVMLLERDGKLSLDDDVRRWLPELPRYERPITVRHLLSHTSGLRDFFELLIIARGRFEEERITDADAMGVVRRQRKLNFAPDSEYGYSNTNYLLAAKIVERASGERFPAFVRSRILAPLGMMHTSLRDDVTLIVPGRAVGYTRDGTGWRTSVPNFDVLGSTNLETTVGDLLRLSENLHHPIVGDSSILRRMLTPAVLASGDTTSYGLGLAVVRDRGQRLAEHEGRDPGFRAYLGRWLEPRVAVALLCNTTAINPVGIGRDVGGLAIGLPPQAPPLPPQTTPGDAKAALRWAGVYLEPTTRQVAELTVRDGMLYTDRTGGARVEAIGPRRARLAGQPLDLAFDSAAHPGYVVRWSIPNRRADRFVWKAPAAPVLDRVARSEYAGTYASPELGGAMYHVEAGDSTLVLRAGTTPGLVARAVFPDGFVSGQYTIEFVRRGGRAMGFEISQPRARGVEFVREP